MSNLSEVDETIFNRRTMRNTRTKKSTGFFFRVFRLVRGSLCFWEWSPGPLQSEILFVLAPVLRICRPDRADFLGGELVFYKYIAPTAPPKTRRGYSAVHHVAVLSMFISSPPPPRSSSFARR